MTTVSGGIERGFREALARLDERGCSLLVAGQVGPDDFAALCQRLNGEPHLDRRRVLVGTGSEEGSADRYLPDDVRVDDEHVRLIEAFDLRSAAVAQGPGATTGVPEPATLEADIQTAIDDLEPATGYEPGMLRVVVTSIEPLIEAHGHDTVRRWVRIVSSEVTDLSVRGRAAFVAPCAPDDAQLRPLQDVFDARIEVKATQSRTLHRWVVSPEVLEDRDAPLETEWIAIPE